ncbi:hypothetical protein [Lentzea sp. NBRC 102530]|uniref:hypothetical protein n=1 Tax=Lentzea sp. NBRC 102530 TaxID=3032201 RepID=UPI00255570EF|nr:hypothetical protein [Lentzea sp. NBRC 102530]
MAAVLITGADEALARETSRLLTSAGHTVVAAAGDLDVLIIDAGAPREFESALAEVVRVLQEHLPLLERSAAPTVVITGHDEVAEAIANLVAVQYARSFPRLRINAAGPDAALIAATAQVGPDGPSGAYFESE